MVSSASQRENTQEINHKVSFLDNELSFNHKISILYLISQILIWVGILTLVLTLYPIF
jgi:hypothetical protein